jgi:hypothetical protein
VSSERWIYVKEDGTIILHTENDGWTFMRHGPEAVEKVLSPQEAIQNRPKELAKALLERETEREAAREKRWKAEHPKN